MARNLVPTLVTRQRPRNPEAVFYLERAQGGAPLKERPEVDDIEIEPSLHPEMLYGCEVVDKWALRTLEASSAVMRGQRALTFARVPLAILMSGSASAETLRKLGFDKRAKSLVASMPSFGRCRKES